MILHKIGAFILNKYPLFALNKKLKKFIGLLMRRCGPELVIGNVIQDSQCDSHSESHCSVDHSLGLRLVSA